MLKKKPIIALDGPVGAGKTTTARKVAEILGFKYVDTGAMYRAVTLDVLLHGIDPADEEGIGRIVSDTDVKLQISDKGQRTFLNGVDVTERIRERDVTRAVSAVSAVKSVRKKMTDLQRAIGKDGGIVMEGRDIGTVVFPAAEFKIYLDASVDVRANRRFEELRGKGLQIEIDELKKEIIERDRANTERSLAPLKKAPDAVVIDTENMTFDEQVDAVISLVRRGTE